MLLVVDILRSYETVSPMSTPAEQHPHNVKRPIEELFDAMHHGKWRFSDFAETAVAANVAAKSFVSMGKRREILVPNEKIKGLHEFLRLFLLNYLPINGEVVFSYRKGFSAYDAVSKHSANKAFFLCDVSNFFPSIKRHRIKSTLAKAGSACPIENLDDWLDRIVDIVCLNDALPVGFSTSPVISNSALLPFDNELQLYCSDKGLAFTRYSDDIIVSTENPASLEGIQERISDIMREATQGEISLNLKKSKTLHKGKKIKLLGMVLLPNGGISIDASVKDEIEVLIHFYLHDKSKFANRVDDDIRKAEARLAGLINYANTVDPAYIDKLRKKFGVTIVDYFFHRSFS